MIEKLKLLFQKLNEKGIPIPLLTDPRTKIGSVSLTMLVISFNIVLIGLVGKWSKYLDIDLQQAIYWFMVCSGLYFGRAVSKNGNNTQLDNKEIK